MSMTPTSTPFPLYCCASWMPCCSLSTPEYIREESLNICIFWDMDTFLTEGSVPTVASDWTGMRAVRSEPNVLTTWTPAASISDVDAPAWSVTKASTISMPFTLRMPVASRCDDPDRCERNSLVAALNLEYCGTDFPGTCACMATHRRKDKIRR